MTKRPVGRPFSGRTEKHQITMKPETWKILRELGEGNASVAVEALAEHVKRRRLALDDLAD